MCQFVLQICNELKSMLQIFAFHLSDHILPAKAIVQIVTAFPAALFFIGIEG
jgi:hypothetical protein